MNAHLQASYPQALAKLIQITGNVSVAEDCLHGACEKALIRWKNQVPDSPTGWLVTVAKNQFIDLMRRENKSECLSILEEPSESPDLSEEALLASYNDDLLRLIFTSCHPALKPETQISLALKHILGLSNLQIANALMINEKTLEKRLTRAKKKIIANNIAYEIPAESRRKERLNGVLKTIYLLFNEGYFSTGQKDLIKRELCKEAIRLCRMLHQCIRGEAEIIGLLALMLHLDARADARTKNDGQPVILSEQNRKKWDKNSIQEANQLVEKALMIGGGKPYSIQAAIASLHNSSTTFESTDWPQIFELYMLLNQIENSPVAELNAYVAYAQFADKNTAIEKVKALETKLNNYRHYFTVLAGLHFENNEFDKAAKYYKMALEQAEGQREEKFIRERIDLCNN